MEGRGEENGDSRGDFDTGIFLKTVNVCINDDLGELWSCEFFRDALLYDTGAAGTAGICSSGKGNWGGISCKWEVNKELELD